MTKSETELDKNGLDKSEVALGKTPGVAPWFDQYLEYQCIFKNNPLLQDQAT